MHLWALVLLVGTSWAAVRPSRPVPLASIWAGPIASALEALGPAWVQTQGLRSLIAFETIRAEGGFELEHNIKRLGFLARSLRKSHTPEAFEELRKQPYLLGEALAEAAREAEEHADAEAGRIYSELDRRTRSGEDPREEADNAQSFLEEAGPYIPEVSAGEIQAALGKARDLQYRLASARAAQRLAEGLRQIQAETGLPIPTKLLKSVQDAAGEAPGSSKKEPGLDNAQWAAARREGRDLRFDGKSWVSAGFPYQYFDTFEALADARLAAVGRFDAGPWSKELLDNQEKALQQPEFQIQLEKEGGSALVERIKSKIAAKRAALTPKIEQAGRRRRRELEAVSKPAHPLLTYAAVFRLARRHLALQQRAFEVPDKGLEDSVLERLWYGRPEEGFPGWQQLQAKVDDAERALTRVGIRVGIAYASSIALFSAAKLAFLASPFEAATAMLMFSLLAIMTYLVLRRIFDTFVPQTMRLAAEHFFRKVFGEPI